MTDSGRDHLLLSQPDKGYVPSAGCAQNNGELCLLCLVPSWFLLLFDPNLQPIVSGPISGGPVWSNMDEHGRQDSQVGRHPPKIGSTKSAMLTDRLTCRPPSRHPQPHSVQGSIRTPTVETGQTRHETSINHPVPPPIRSIFGELGSQTLPCHLLPTLDQGGNVRRCPGPIPAPVIPP